MLCYGSFMLFIPAPVELSSSLAVLPTGQVLTTTLTISFGAVPVVSKMPNCSLVNR
ncbi:unnamed protein product [Dibothriocephalus latus]|uniref:Uncharacterized protein n=1 Tax=Dibothriocephalus latus TaxID=60516 RepID=A0A3P7PA50_DIBLA|nr:unnamed protein product [Dibothriocephalus latus]